MFMSFGIISDRSFREKMMVLAIAIILMNAWRHHAAQMHIVMILWDRTFAIVNLDMKLTHIKTVSISMNAQLMVNVLMYAQIRPG